MFLGHYGLALAAKRAAPRTSLGTLAFAAQFLDQLWPFLLLAGVERVKITPGITAANALEFEHYPISHSLLTAALWAALVGGIYAAVRKYGRGAWVVGGLVLSHWFLDLPMHRPDLPLWPGSDVKVGLGLWNSIPITLVAEIGVFAVGLVVYLRTTRARDAIGRWAPWGLAALLVAIFVGSALGPPPPSAQAVAYSSLGLWLFVAMAWWADRHREVVDAAPSRSR